MADLAAAIDFNSRAVSAAIEALHPIATEEYNRLTKAEGKQNFTFGPDPETAKLQDLKSYSTGLKGLETLIRSHERKSSTRSINRGLKELIRALSNSEDGQKSRSELARKIADERLYGNDKLSSYLARKAVLGPISAARDVFDARKDKRLTKHITRASSACATANTNLSALDANISGKTLFDFRTNLERLHDIQDTDLRSVIAKHERNVFEGMIYSCRDKYEGSRLKDIRDTGSDPSSSANDITAKLKDMTLEHQKLTRRNTQIVKAEHQQRLKAKDIDVEDTSLLKASVLEHMKGLLDCSEYQVVLDDDPGYHSELLQYLKENYENMQWELSKWYSSQVDMYKQAFPTHNLDETKVPTEQFKSFMKTLNSDQTRTPQGELAWVIVRKEEYPKLEIINRASSIISHGVRRITKDIQAERTRLINSLNHDASYQNEPVRSVAQTLLGIATYDLLSVSHTGEIEVGKLNRGKDAHAKRSRTTDSVKDTVLLGSDDLASATEGYLALYADYLNTPFGNKNLWSEIEEMIPDLSAHSNASKEQEGREFEQEEGTSSRTDPADVTEMSHPTDLDSFEAARSYVPPIRSWADVVRDSIGS
ncbi:hypothetical protein I203_101076 [Kwoniella mangroviensis CBS 8507]|uniref:uncharacterized protein n=1 Tax=Kwoniella mangroviensis CBS 8507 TaxID=1296122 RepID=UPI00305C3FCE